MQQVFHVPNQITVRFKAVVFKWNDEMNNKCKFGKWSNSVIILIIYATIACWEEVNGVEPW